MTLVTRELPKCLSKRGTLQIDSLILAIKPISILQTSMYGVSRNEVPQESATYEDHIPRKLLEAPERSCRAIFKMNCPSVQAGQGGELFLRRPDF